MNRNQLTVIALIMILMMLVGSLVTSMVMAQQASTKWEYLTVDYTQQEVFGADYEPDLEATRYEVLMIAESTYDELFTSIVVGECDLSEGLAFNTEAQECMGKNFKGAEFFLNILGEDGWELISINNTSNEYTYRLEWVFKRPKSA